MHKSLEEFAKQAAGNWRDFESFDWFKMPPDPTNWCLFYISHKDADLLKESNEKEIDFRLKEFIDPAEEWPDVVKQKHGHHSAGWMMALIIRVYKDGEITPAFKSWHKICLELNTNSTLNKDDYSYKQYCKAIENIQKKGESSVIKNAAENWSSLVYHYLAENDANEVLYKPNGPEPSLESITYALDALGICDPFLKPYKKISEPIVGVLLNKVKNMKERDKESALIDVIKILGRYNGSPTNQVQTIISRLRQNNLWIN